jgi:hypothetical protein
VLGHVALIQRLFGSPQPGFMLEHYRLIILLPFFSILVGLAFLRSHRGEILDQL